jgi:hypothetical protein
MQKVVVRVFRGRNIVTVVDVKHLRKVLISKEFLLDGEYQDYIKCLSELEE